MPLRCCSKYKTCDTSKGKYAVLRDCDISADVPTGNSGFSYLLLGELHTRQMLILVHHE